MSWKQKRGRARGVLGELDLLTACPLPDCAIQP